MLYYVKIEDLGKVWPLAAPLLQKAIDRSQHDCELEDYLEEAQLGVCQLFVWIKEETVTAACILRVSNRPRKRVCEMPLIAGTDMENWLLVEDKIVEWAKAQGCTQLEGYCRDGWLRVLKNWNKVWTTMRRDL